MGPLSQCCACSLEASEAGSCGRRVGISPTGAPDPRRPCQRGLACDQLVATLIRIESHRHTFFQCVALLCTKLLNLCSSFDTEIEQSMDPEQQVIEQLHSAIHRAIRETSFSLTRISSSIRSTRCRQGIFIPAIRRKSRWAANCPDNSRSIITQTTMQC